MTMKYKYSLSSLFFVKPSLFIKPFIKLFIFYQALYLYLYLYQALSLSSFIFIFIKLYLYLYQALSLSSFIFIFIKLFIFYQALYLFIKLFIKPFNSLSSLFFCQAFTHQHLNHSISNSVWQS